MRIEVYCTSFCNHGHVVSTGKPVEHECYILPPKAIAAEIRGDYDKANDLIHAAKPMRTMLRGVRSPK